MVLAPGEQQPFELAVENVGAEATDFKVYVSPYNMATGMEDLDFESDLPRTQIARWITFDAERYHLEVNERKVLKYHVAVPEDAPYGQQYAVIFVESAGQVNSEGVNMVSRLGTVIYANVSGETREASRITKMKAPWLVLSSDIKISGKVKNTGNTDFNAKHELTVKTLFTHQTLHEFTETYEVLPDTEPEVKLTLENSPNFGIYKLEYKISIPGEEKTITRYTLIMPIWCFIIFTAAVASTVIFVILSKRRKKQQKPKNSQ
jgi:hypothetical protein